jgi:hypothetical protein
VSLAPDPAAVTGDQRLRPARRVAARLVRAHDLAPAIDIEALLDARAERRVAQLPVAGDLAVLTAAPGAPLVLEQPRLAADDRRRRVALAHALAHVELPWHVGCASCSVGTGFDAVEQWSGDVSVRGVAEAEAEAFAMQLLAPAAWLRDEVVDASPVDSVVRAASLAMVPLAFAATAVARQLDPGVVWAIVDAWQTVRHAGCSPGTVATVPSVGVELDDGPLTAAARRAERRVVDGLVLQAWVLDQERARRPASAGSVDALEEIVADLRLVGGRAADLRAAINGVVGSGWGSRDHDGPAELEQVLHDRFADVVAQRAPAGGMLQPSTPSGRHAVAGAIAAGSGSYGRPSTAPRSTADTDLLDATRHPAFPALLRARAEELYARRRG